MTYHQELKPGEDIDFSVIEELFDPSEWDVGFLSDSGFSRSAASPIKIKFHEFGYDITNTIHSLVWNGIVLARKTETTNDYSLYEEAVDILLSEFEQNQFVPTYTNFKESALLSGIGTRARNSLIYNRKFGFQCKFCAFMFVSNIINVPESKVNNQLLDLCDGCDDCIRNCPAGAIHENWVDAKACDNHIGQDIKWFWYEKMKPDIPLSEVESWKNFNTMPELEWGQGVDGFYEKDGWKLKKDGEIIPIPSCKECALQPRCSKMPCLS